jgi:hypothetical protein
VIGIDAAYMRDGQYFSEYRLRDAQSGREAEAAIGLRNRIGITRGVWFNTSFEHTRPIEGINAPQEATAITGALEFLRSRDWKATARFEYRFAENNDDDWLGSLGFTQRLSRGWSMLAHSQLGARAGDLRARNQLGVAWRNDQDGHFNALGRIEHRFDRAPGNFLEQIDRTRADTLSGVIADLVDYRRHAWIASGHLNYMPGSKLSLAGQLAAKRVDYRSFNESSNTNGVLGMMHASYDIDRNWDVGLIGSLVGTAGIEQRNSGLGIELGRTLATNLQAVIGYNLFGFTDPDFRSENSTQQGFFLRLRLKFDEQLLGRDR